MMWLYRIKYNDAAQQDNDGVSWIEVIGLYATYVFYYGTISDDSDHIMIIFSQTFVVEMVWHYLVQ